MLPITQALYNYNGRQVPPEEPALLFFVGDMIQITDDDDDDWHKGYLIRPTSNRSSLRKSLDEGYFPRTCVELVTNLDNYDWYSSVKREVARKIFDRIDEYILAKKNSVPVFMVLPSNIEGDYAITIKYKGNLENIRVETKRNEMTAVSYSIDGWNRSFNSIQSLVSYYSLHALSNAGYSKLDTTLGLSFRNALPNLIAIAIAKYDYMPSEQANQIPLKIGQRYFVIEKKINKWWNVYNTDGLIGYVPGEYLDDYRSSAVPILINSNRIFANKTVESEQGEYS